MSWLAPGAWLGLLLVGVPIAIHLLSRKPPRVMTFPTLRFLRASDLRPTRRSEISDWPLLLLRMAILALACAALAQPLFSIASKTAASEPASTIVVVDTGIWMPGLDANNAAAQDNPAITDVSSGLANSERSTSHTLFTSTANLEDAIGSAVNWLRTRPAPRHLVLQSAFPTSAVDSVSFARLPSDIKLSLEVTEPRSAASSVPQTANASLATGADNQETWARDTIHWLTDLDEQSANAVVRAVYESGGAVVEVHSAGNTTDSIIRNSNGSWLLSARDVSVPGHTADSSSSGNSSESQHVVSRLVWVGRAQEPRALTAQEWIGPAARSTEPQNNVQLLTPLLFDAAGNTAVEGLVLNGQPVLISRLPERPTLLTALLLAFSDNPYAHAVRRLDGIDSTRVDAATLKQWETLPAGSALGAGLTDNLHSGVTQARWLWLAVLILLGVEWKMRRHSPGTKASSATTGSTEA